MITPGIPNTAENKILNTLMGSAIPKFPPKKYTRKSPATPLNILMILKTGLLLFL